MTEPTVRNREALADTPAASVALDCVAAGIEAAHPRRVVAESVSLDGSQLRVADAVYDLDAHESVVVLGGGNAAAAVAAALESVLGDRLDGGVVVTDGTADTERVEVLPADHPTPSERGAESTRRLLDRAAAIDEGTLVLAPVTGGASACMVAPAEGLSLSDLRETTETLVTSGASIHEINAVRKHCSALKGGLLARRVAPASTVVLAFSDVVGDDLDVIASGPFAPDTSTYADALAVLEEYDLSVPTAVRDHLERGRAGDLPETPKPGETAFDRVETHVLASNRTALDAAREVARERGYETLVLSSRVTGEARCAAPIHAAVAAEALATDEPVTPPAVVLSGGETTVRVEGDGRGGPNAEFALAAALDLPETAWLAAVDTDGVDGATGAAGALVDGGLLAGRDDRRAAKRALEANDAGGFLAARDRLVETGPTGTNVNDLRVLVVPDDDS